MRLENEERAKLEKLKQIFNEQSTRDRERIEYRNKLIAKKKDELNSMKMAKQSEIEMKEKKLEKFFEAVKPNVETDPVRVISFTEVSKFLIVYFFYCRIKNLIIFY